MINLVKNDNNLILFIVYFENPDNRKKKLIMIRGGTFIE